MEQFFRDNFRLLIILAIVSQMLVVLASICYRAWKGKKRLNIPETDLTFSEKWVSGFSHKNFLTKHGGAANCLRVELSRNALVVRPMFPFNLMFFPEVYDLEHFIPKDKIKRLQPGAEDGDKGKVLIEFEGSNGEKRIELMLRKRREFLIALGTASGPQPVPSGIFT
jgi:hypothetical protein